MATQLTLITVPAAPAQETTEDAATPVRTLRSAPTRVAPAPTPVSSGGAGTAVHRRSAGHTGWLDRRTISSGRKGVAAARAALADATRRVADREAQDEAERESELVRRAGDLARSATHSGRDRHAA